jgi:hypothetical protein
MTACFPQNRTAFFVSLALWGAACAARSGAAALRARGSILAMTEVLTQHAAYFEAGAPG